MKIYITRHGETEWNKQGRMQGWKNSNLTEKGVDNAIKLGKSLKHIDFDYIYCSPLGRAIDTANYIRGDKNTEIIIIESLKEMGFGVYEGMENEKVKELYRLQQYNFWNKPHLYETTDGEKFEELIHRVKQVLKYIINNTTCENILIVTHTLVIKALYLIIKNRSLEDFWKPPFMYDTCLTVLEVQGTKIEIIIEADISHLD
ncbi:histidine phosphatase family protein [Clostridium sp.]|uniref:histidine phosphatase family protein n=1 Tax=Clostridium sp. TaxID=1506 RepID=UPI001A372E69|nr:histidine phosphatase family protein [Clostridium sp.]MBK5243327.1 histidine phosphatase family protein [Clostridium sp.]